MVIKMVRWAMFWLNAFPHKNGLSKTISLRTLVTGIVDHSKHCKFEFGQYVQVHDQHDHIMNLRTTRAIALYPTRNAQVSFIW